MFWGKNSQGYRYNIDDAGLYSKDDIKSFSGDSQNVPVHKDIIDAMSTKSVIDQRKLGRICLNNRTNRQKLNISLTELRKGESAWDSRAFCDPETFVELNEHIIAVIEEIKKEV